MNKKMAATALRNNEENGAHTVTLLPETRASKYNQHSTEQKSRFFLIIHPHALIFDF